MKAMLIILCLSAFTVVAVMASLLVKAILPYADRLADRLKPRHRVRLWLSLAALPGCVAVLAMTAALLPAMGVGRDHCLAHGAHHLHLCPHHLNEVPGAVLWLITAALLLRVAYLIISLLGELWRSRRTAVAFAQACQDRDGIRIIASDDLHAFVLGLLRPQVHLSRGLLALGPAIVAPVLAHERAHAKHRDVLWRALAPLIALGHLPQVTQPLWHRLMLAQEMAADEEAALALPQGRIRLAEALVRLTRLSKRTRGPGIAFTHGDLRTRVQALLQPTLPRAAWPRGLALIASLALPISIAVCHDFVHHTLETLLSALS